MATTSDQTAFFIIPHLEIIPQAYASFRATVSSGRAAAPHASDRAGSMPVNGGVNSILQGLRIFISVHILFSAFDCFHIVISMVND